MAHSVKEIVETINDPGLTEREKINTLLGWGMDLDCIAHFIFCVTETNAPSPFAFETCDSIA